MQKKMQEQTEETLYLSKLNPDTYQLGFDKSIMRHILNISVKQPITGVACSECSQYQAPFYFCREEHKIYCKTCLLFKHKPKTHSSDPEHYDYKVEVDIENKLNSKV